MYRQNMKTKPILTQASYAVLAAMLLTCTAAWAQQEPAAAPRQDTAAPAPRKTSLEADPLLTTGKLANGLSYMIRPTKEPAGRASLRLYVGVGSLHETEENSGISHFLEHMVFNGSRSFKRGELIPTMQKLGLGFGGDANAYTSLLHTVYMLDLPNLQERTVNFAFTIMRDFADGATLEADAIDHERGIVISELKSRDSAAYRSMISVLGQLTEGTRVAQFMPIGREQVIRHASYDTVRDYYHDHYVPENMTVILTGDIDPAQGEAWIKQHFESMQPRQGKPAPELGTLCIGEQKERLFPNQETASCNLMINLITPFEQHEDTLEQRIKDFPLQLAFSMLNRRLGRLTQKEDCPFSAASAARESVFRASETTGLSLSAKPENWKAALSTAMIQLRQAAQYGFSEQEYKEALGSYFSSLEHACETWETVTAQSIASQLISSISDKEVVTNPQENLAVAKLQAELVLSQLKQGHDLCREALAETFATPEKAILTLTGALPEGVDAPALRAAYNESLQADIPQPAEQKPLVFAYDTIGMPGVVLQKSYLEDLGVTQLTLSNGIRVNLKPITFRKGSISVTAAVDGGAISLPRTPGLKSMLNAVMQCGGLREHSMDELQSIMAGNQVSLHFRLSDTRFLYSGSTNAEDFELQCKLLAAAILHPGFRNEGEIIMRRGLDSRYKQLTTTPDGVLSMQLRRKLFGEDPRFVTPLKEQIEARNTQEVQALLTAPLQSNAMEVSIVGDFEVDKLIPAIERTFGAMPQRRKEFNSIPDAQRAVEFAEPWGQRTYLRYPTELDKTIVAQVRPAGNGRDERRNRRLQILASIVREKLFDGLRATMGESYSPRVQVVANSEYDNAAYIMTISAGVKGNRAKVSAAMDSICSGIGQGFITRDDFDCAYRPFRAQVQKMITSPGYWEESLEQLQSDPERLALMRDIVEDTNKITYEEIQALGREIFGNENSSFFFVVPEDYNENETTEEPTAPTPPQADLTSLNTPAPGEYAVLSTADTAKLPEWKQVIDTLVQKYPGATFTQLDTLTEESCAKALREAGARYAAVVLRPQEISRTLVNTLHRATRQLDDDPYGDCIWGLITGYTAADAQRIANAKEPLVIRRVLSTTNVDASRFEQSYCITDWEGFPILSQKGYTKPTKTTYTMDTPEGQHILENGVQGKFANQLSTQKNQLIVTSSHATPFNLEMPFSKGLIFSANNRFYQMGCKQLPSFFSALHPAMEGKTGALQSLAEAMQFPAIEPDTTERVWLACGNCLIGDARQTDQSMVITALSAYNCNQFVGYTVPSWYGEAGWGTLALFMGNTDNTTLAEAFFLNNQFLLESTRVLNPRLLSVHFNEPELGPALQRDLLSAGVNLKSREARDAVGLVHDRDTLAFYGDPGWAALVDHSHAHAPLRISWQDNTTCTLTANTDYTGRAAIWFPRAEIGRSATGCDVKGALFTNDFILIPSITLKAGESRVIHLTQEEQKAS